MLEFINRLTTRFQSIPADAISYLARLAVGATFLRSGMLKVEGWSEGNTLALFKDEYRLPIIPPEIAAYLATAAELTLPVLLFAGLFTRFASLGLLFMTIVIEVFVYPDAFDTHGLWAVALLYLMKFGPGAAALDTVLGLNPPSARLLAASGSKSTM